MEPPSDILERVPYLKYKSPYLKAGSQPFIKNSGISAESEKVIGSTLQLILGGFQ